MEDDGRGCDPARAVGHGMGLQGIRDRFLLAIQRVILPEVRRSSEVYAYTAGHAAEAPDSDLQLCESR